jgi:hypothetical protein
MLVCKLWKSLRDYLKSNSNKSVSPRIEIAEWQYHHEIGHGIIAHIFDGYLFDFKGITFDPEEIKKLNLNPDDKAYTITYPIKDYHNFVDQNHHNAALVDGLHLLSGAAGATFFDTTKDFSLILITPVNINSEVNLKGAGGDLEIIKNGRRPYGWYLKMQDMDNSVRAEVHSKLFQILLELFIRTEITTRITTLYSIATQNNRITPQDFKNTFDLTLTSNLKSELLNSISIGKFGLIGH